MRLKKIFASHRAQPTQATERSGIIAFIYKLLHIRNKAWYNYVKLHLKSYKLALCKMYKILN